MSENGWRPLLGGDLARRAEEAIDRIAAGLPRLPMPRPGSRQPTGAAALGSGQAGQALFWAYLALDRDDEAAAERADSCLDAALEEVAGAALTPTFYGGFPGTAWVDQHLRGRLYEAEDGEADDDLLLEIDEAVLATLEKDPRRQDYDLIRGMVGLGVYALERLPAAGAVRCVERVVECLAATAVELPGGISWLTSPDLLIPVQREEYPEGHYNVGVAHGVPGVVAFLGGACLAGISRDLARPLLEGAASWVLSTELAQVANSLSRFPTAVVPGGHGAEPSRLAWCYGDPGLAAALLAAGRAVGSEAIEAAAVRVARRVAVRRVDGTGIVDPGLCHGSVGLGHLFNRFHQATGEEVFADTARFWYAHALDQVREEGATGFFTQVPISDTELEWQEIGGFLNGVAGIGLALLAAVSPVAPDWDRILLVSLRPPVPGPGPQPRDERARAS